MAVPDEARAWLAADPDERMRALLSDLIALAEAGDQAAADEIADAFDGTLQFGTAGLRGRIGPGPNRMNVVVVARAAAGLARYLSERGGGAVVIGYDARHDSDLFARATAQILTGAGLSVMMLPGPLPTPVLAFAIRRLGCAAGVMVTASHNPPEDNGYKVYLGDGSQIVPPADAEISAHIAAVAASGPVTDLPHGEEWDTLGDEIVAEYVARAAALVEDGPPMHLRLAYTPMHGVGGELFLRVLEEAGLPEPVIVEAQFAPDPDFPTVAFPNPEEPGAMDLALAAAEEHECDLLIANDPDADRCAVGVPAADGWRMLSGDEVGWLLGWWIAAGNRRLSRPGTFAESIVSGTMLEKIAADSNIAYVQTLTGFKWIARVPDLWFGYEEALGYCVDPNGVRDKDGISAGLMVAEMAARLKQWNTSLLHVLDDLASEYGVHATRQVSVRVQDLSRIDTIMTTLRTDPPGAIAGIAVTDMVDLAEGTEALPPTDGLVFHLESGARVVIRPSGTEPKVKCYLQSVVIDEAGDLPAARAAAEAELDAIGSEVSRWLQ
ncbi:MAG: phospho-sugar mutase [Actinomycetales bacterium]|nr:phospho-sugar mutase [Actinomycetales bacterium]